VKSIFVLAHSPNTKMMVIAEEYVGAELVFAWIGLGVVIVTALGGMFKLVEYLITQQRPRGQPLLDVV
jgi:hypothetical protein